MVYHPYDSLLLGLYQGSIDANNKVVEVRLEKIINNYGWPGYQMNGYTHKDYSLIFSRGAEWFYKMEIKLKREIDK